MAWLGIDFSGDATRWRPRLARPTVWVAHLVPGTPRPRLVDLRPVQDLAGSGDPFDRLVARLRQGDFRVCALDAPLSWPGADALAGGRQALLDAVLGLPVPDRPFARGDAMLVLAGSLGLPCSGKVFRPCETLWRARGLNVRSTTWNGARPGTPFTVAALTLCGRAGLPCWPWVVGARPCLAETFPTALLARLGLPYRGYDGPGGGATRTQILDALAPGLDLPATARAMMAGSADALDAVLAALGAMAVDLGRMVDPAPVAGRDGWIAVLDALTDT